METADDKLEGCTKGISPDISKSWITAAQERSNEEAILEDVDATREQHFVSRE